MNKELNFAQYGLAVPEVLLPAKHINLKKWAVIACDQFTQDKSYWQRAEAETADEPSALHLIFPEAYLEDAGRNERLTIIHTLMNTYLENGTFAEPVRGFIYMERKTAYGRTRKGLLAAIDLDTYEWKPFSESLIRATEGTIIDRLPPRMEIRRNAPLELPHIMLLVNDPDKLLVEGTGERVKSKKQPLYDTELLFDSGHITGWAADTEELLEYTASALKKVAVKNLYKSETGIGGSPFMFAAGDGNHSLASAKAVWDEYKVAHSEVTDHPLRYALAEIVNIYDEGLTFEPIHRVLFNADIPLLIRYIKAELNSNTSEVASAKELEQAVRSSEGAFGLVYTDVGGKKHFTLFEAECPDLMVCYFQPILDAYMSIISETSIDFIHGTEEVFRLGLQPNSAGILLPPIEKDNFFATIYACGILPRKSFSMGEASEKRFYLEARKI